MNTIQSPSTLTRSQNPNVLLRASGTIALLTSLIGCAAAVEGSTTEDGEESVGEATQALGTTFTVGRAGYGSFHASFDNSNLYLSFLPGEFCTGGIGLEKMSLSTGVKTTLLGGTCKSPAEHVSDGTNLYFLEWGADDVRRIPTAGGAPDVFVADTTGAIYHRGIEQDASRVYWSDNVGIRSRAKTGGVTTTHFASTKTELLGIDATHLYFRNNPAIGTYELRRVPIAGGASALLTTDSRLFGHFQVDATSVYWTANPTTTSTAIRRMPKAGGAVTSLYSLASQCVTSIELANGNLYWLENTTCDILSGSGRLRRRTNAAGAGAISTQKTGLVAPYSLEVRGSSIYWLDGGYERFLRRASLTSPPTSCDGACGSMAAGGCYCDAVCETYGDCCADYALQCS